MTSGQDAALAALAQAFPDRAIVVIGATALAWHYPDFRGTLDLDVCVAIDVDEHARAEAPPTTWRRQRSMPHRWRTDDDLLVDVLPACDRLLADGRVSWPDGASMDLAGIDLVMRGHLPFGAALPGNVLVASRRVAPCSWPRSPLGWIARRIGTRTSATSRGCSTTTSRRTTRGDSTNRSWAIANGATARRSCWASICAPSLPSAIADASATSSDARAVRRGTTGRRCGRMRHRRGASRRTCRNGVSGPCATDSGCRDPRGAGRLTPRGRRVPRIARCVHACSMTRRTHVAPRPLKSPAAPRSPARRPAASGPSPPACRRSPR